MYTCYDMLYIIHYTLYNLHIDCYMSYVLCSDIYIHIYRHICSISYIYIHTQSLGVLVPPGLVGPGARERLALSGSGAFGLLRDLVFNWIWRSMLSTQSLECARVDGPARVFHDYLDFCYAGHRRCCPRFSVSLIPLRIQF